jgi:hypothetical protein
MRGGGVRHPERAQRNIRLVLLFGAGGLGVVYVLLRYQTSTTEKKTLKNKKPRCEAKLLSSGCIYLPSFSTGLYPDQEESACSYSDIKLCPTSAGDVKEGFPLQGENVV